MTQTDLTGWGRFGRIATRLHAPRSAADTAPLLQQPVIARGNGLAYGDSAVSAKQTISTRHMSRMLHFDPDCGVLQVQSGVTLADIAAAMLPRGWFLPVLPGSGHVTVGGAIAADVHGKNHLHAGSFRSCVVWIDLMGQDGTVRRCSPTERPDLFDHTLGGMGLTGIILCACLRLVPVESGWIWQEQQCTANFHETVAKLRDARAAPYSVAWLDGVARGPTFGRGLVMTGHHARHADLSAAQVVCPNGLPAGKTLSLPFDWPNWVLNPASIRVFNAVHVHRSRKATAPHLVDWRRFFFPLDAVGLWPRAYGRRGLVQFQCVLPHATAEAGLEQILCAAQTARCPPFLAVLKELGPQEGAFSFPMPGLTLALDFPASPSVLALLDTLDAIVLNHGGRFYLAKDARMQAHVLRAADPRTEAFAAYRAAHGFDRQFQSAQSERVKI